LIVLAGWLYWQNVKLQEQNVRLHRDLAAATIALKRLHKSPPVPKDDNAFEPAIAAQKHLTLATNAWERKDYGTAVHELELAQDDAKKATSGVSEKSREAGREIQTQLDSLREKLSGVAGQWVHPKRAKSTDDSASQ
jgi:predicted negative regulator of RcsB-dependent stress response